MVMIEIERFNNRIHLKSKWAPGLPERCRGAGGRWSKSKRVWTYPLSMEMCRALRAEFGDALVIGNDLAAWARQENKREQSLVALGNISGVDGMKAIQLPTIKKDNPPMWMAMEGRPYQPVASLFCAEAKQALLADQPGLGKTIEVLGSLVEGHKSGAILVLAPLKSTQAVWVPEIHKWMAEYRHGYSVVRASGAGRGRKLDGLLARHHEELEANPAGMHFMVINAEMARVMRKFECPSNACTGNDQYCYARSTHVTHKVPTHSWLFEREWSAIIADETHQWLINTTGKRASQVGFGFTMLKTEPDNYRVALTGTPLKGKQHNLWGTLNWLRPDIYSSKWQWINRYFDVEQGEYAPTIGSVNKSMEPEFFRALSAIMLRRTKSELRAVNPLWMPPDKVYHDIWIDMDTKQSKAYSQMANESIAELESGTVEAQGVLSELTRLKQFAGMCGDLSPEGKYLPALPSNKFDWLIEFLSERGIERDLAPEVQKVVVASQFTGMIDVMSKELSRLGIKHCVITGKTKDAMLEVDRFQKQPEYRVCLINTKAGGVSITLDAADDIVIFDETWVPDEQEQVEDRVHRASNISHRVDVWYLRSTGTVEEQIAGVNVSKGLNNHTILDAQRGLEFVRSLAKSKNQQG